MTASPPPDATQAQPAHTQATATTSATAAMATKGTSSTGSARTGGHKSATSRRIGAGLVQVPLVTRRDPASAVLANPLVPEERRFCSTCGEKVGRTQDDHPGLPDGSCPRCGKVYSFTPKLVAGDLVGGQYQVVGCLAHGGLGWIYLATDKRVSDRWVVLKGLLDSGDAAAAAVAVAEARFLAEVEHPNIVRIYNFVEHQGASYIVMEYVGGVSLKDQLRARREAAGGASPMPVAMAIAYMLEVLPAFGYLHEHGLLFNDFKPDNVIETPDQVKLIDLGAVIRFGDDDADIYGTVGYQAPEVGREGPSVESDLYTVARTLAVLATDFRGYQSTFVHSLPERSAVEVYEKFESLHRFLSRATAADRHERFHSADEMAEQLVGVLREVLAADGEARPAPSRLFTVERVSELTRADWRSIPALLPDPDDPAAAYLASLFSTDSSQRVQLLDQAPEKTLGVELAAVRALIDNAASHEHPVFDAAAERLSRCIATFGNDWRANWYHGLILMATGREADAVQVFEESAGCLPGELAPKLALAMALELSGDTSRAATYYDVVSRTDPTFTTACAGLARCRVAAHDRDGAVEAFDRIPKTSAFHVAGQIEAVRALTESGATMSHVEKSTELLGRLRLPALDDARLRMYVLEYALSAVKYGESLPPGVAASIRQSESDTERAIRLDLEATYRLIARSCDGAEKIEFVDAANAVRPRTWT